MIRISLKVNDMHCPNCAMILESIEDNLPGIKHVSVSYKQGKMLVEFDPALVSIQNIRSEIERLGYHLET